MIPSESLAEDALYSAVEILEQRAAVGEAQFAQVVMEEGMPFPTMLLQYSNAEETAKVMTAAAHAPATVNDARTATGRRWRRW